MYGFKNGVLVSASAGGPAEKAGLKAGDIIATIDGRRSRMATTWSTIIATRKPGTTVRLGYLRSGKQDSTTVTIGDRTKVFAANGTAQNDENQGPGDQSGSEGKLGLSVTEIPASAANQTGLHGVLVESVKPGSFAEEIGVQQGGVIVERE